jgi:hypothetical protein
MEDLIYLLLLIAWAAFALYRRSQKKNATAGKAKAQPEPERDFKPMPTLQEILFGEEATHPEEPAPRSITVIDEGEYNPEPVETDFEREYARRGIISVESSGRPVPSYEMQRTEIQENEISDGIAIGDKKEEYFDLRQAVIYSEILNRPYV